MSRELRQDRSFHDAVEDWIGDGGAADASIRACDGLRYFVPHAAKYPGSKGGVTTAVAIAISSGDVLLATSKQIAAGQFVGPRTMELLGELLRAHDATLADGWDGS